MRIWILTQFYPPEFGAAAIRLSRLARLLAADGHEVTVLTGMPNYPTGIIAEAYRGRFAVNEVSDGVVVRRVWVYATPSKRTLGRIANQISFMLTSALRGLFLPRPDVILVESHPLFIVLSGGWLRRIKRVPVVLNVSDLWPESAVAVGALQADSPLVKAAERVEHWAYRDAAHVVGMTEGWSRSILRSVSDPERVTTIRNAADLERFRPAAPDQRREQRQRLGIDPAAFVLAHIGNMSLTYDFDCMLTVASNLPDCTLLMAGGGSQEAYIREQVEQRNLKNVIFTGILPHDAMPNVWSSVDVLLLSYKDHPVFNGQISAKFYEAMATGTPIAAGARGEICEIMHEHNLGVCVEPGAADALTAVIRDWQRDSQQLHRLAAAGRSYAETHLAPQRVMQAYLDIFLRVTRSAAPER